MNPTGFIRTPSSTFARLGGLCHRFDFPNGYTASVVRHSGSYGSDRGLWELAVMHNGDLVYDTPITDDVIGHLGESDVDALLDKVAALPERKP